MSWARIIHVVAMWVALTALSAISSAMLLPVGTPHRDLAMFVWSIASAFVNNALAVRLTR